MTVAVLPDAQAGIARILRPQNRFEELYQGAQAVPQVGMPSDPIAFFNWGLGDPNPPSPRTNSAGKPGFDPDLLSFMPVAMGSRVLIAIPQIALNGVPTFYRYSIVWRWKNLARYRDEQTGQYHLGTEQAGAPDTTAPVGQQKRFALPAAMETLTAVIGNDIASISELRSDSYWNRMLPVNLPIIGPAGARGHYQQGIVDPAVEGTIFDYLPVFAVFDVTAKADEMMIVADRITGESDQWNFGAGGDDAGFSNLYGTYQMVTPHPNFTDVGIYVWNETTVAAPCSRTSFDVGVGDGGGGLMMAAPGGEGGGGGGDSLTAAFGGFAKIKK